MKLQMHVLERSVFSDKNWVHFYRHFFGKIRPIFDAENDSENQNFEIFAKVVHNLVSPTMTLFSEKMLFHAQFAR